MSEEEVTMKHTPGPWPSMPQLDRYLDLPTNARLMQAAPDLLAALTLIAALGPIFHPQDPEKSYDSAITKLDEARSIARAAVAKATQ
jgi:hypothetical protein